MWRELVSSGRMSCCLSLVLRLFCFVSFSFFFAYTKAAVLRSIVLRSSICMRSDSHTQLPLPASFSVLVSLEIDAAFSEFFVTLPGFFCMESTPYVFSFRMVFFYLVTTGWILDISLCENSINQPINHDFCRVQNLLTSSVELHLANHRAVFLDRFYRQIL